MSSRIQKYLTEALATFCLVFTILWVVRVDAPYTPWLIFAMLTLIIYLGGPISKAHYNPATTLNFQGRRAIEPSLAVGYYISIFSAAILATLIAVNLFPYSPDTSWVNHKVYGPLGEFIGTFNLMWVISYVATLKKTEGNIYYGVAIGGIVLVGIFLFGGVCRACFNPAVALSFFMCDMLSTYDFFVSLMAEVLGATAAFLSFNRVFGKAT